MRLVLMGLMIWGVFMIAWFVVSKYFKSADLTRVKARLLGTNKVQKAAKADAPKQEILTQTVSKENNFAQVVVEKYQLGPKLEKFLEQAGVNWTPARFVQLTIGAAGAGVLLTIFFLPIPSWTAPLVGAAAGVVPFLQIARKRASRLKKFEEIFNQEMDKLAKEKSGN